MLKESFPVEEHSLPIRNVDAVVIGAGPAGLAAAYRLLQSGVRPTVLERSDSVGGLMRSISRGPFTVDLGRKELYTRIPEVDALWQELLGEDYRDYPRRVGSLYQGRILEMSHRFRGPRRGMPWSSFLLGIADLSRAWVMSLVRAPATYEEYWHQRAGRRFAEAFAQGYWERFRGQAWRDMPVPAIHAEGEQAKSHSFSAVAHGLKLAARGGPSGQRRWRHPARGSGQVCELLADRLRRAGVEIQANTEAIRLALSGRTVTEVVAKAPAGHVRYRPANIVSSLPIEMLAELMDIARPNDFESERTACIRRCVVLVYLFLDEPPRFPHAWLEVNDPNLACGRITNYAAFNGEMVPEGKTALCVEYFLGNDSPMHRLAPEAWVRIAVHECARHRLIGPDRIMDTMLHILERCNAAASWRNAQESRRLRLFREIRPYHNLYHVNRPGTDWATFAGLAAADAIAADARQSFERRADPTRSYAESQEAA